MSRYRTSEILYAPTNVIDCYCRYCILRAVFPPWEHSHGTDLVNLAYAKYLIAAYPLNDIIWC